MYFSDICLVQIEYLEYDKVIFALRSLDCYLVPEFNGHFLNVELQLYRDAVTNCVTWKYFLLDMKEDYNSLVRCFK